MSDAPWETLVQAEALAPRLGASGLVVLDCRSSLLDPEAGARAWREGHIPGARHVHLDRDLSGPAGVGRGRHPWPEADAFAARLAAWDVGPDTQVVAYDDGDGAYAARLWWMLHVLGHRAVAVLDGGWTRWSALGLPSGRESGVSDSPRAMPAAATRSAGFLREFLLDAEAVAAHLARGGLLVDARAGERFRGEVEPIDPVAGHVPGAVSRPYAANLAEGRFKPPARLREEFEALLAGRAPGELVAMCGSGVTACHHLLAMAHAGLPGARLYTGSWSGWVSDPSRPGATGA